MPAHRARDRASVHNHNVPLKKSNTKMNSRTERALPRPPRWCRRMVGAASVLPWQRAASHLGEPARGSGDNFFGGSAKRRRAAVAVNLLLRPSTRPTPTPEPTSKTLRRRVATGVPNLQVCCCSCCCHRRCCCQLCLPRCWRWRAPFRLRQATEVGRRSCQVKREREKERQCARESPERDGQTHSTDTR